MAYNGKWNVSFERYAAPGEDDDCWEAEDRGMVDQDIDLRGAVRAWEAFDIGWQESVEASAYPIEDARWITNHGAMDLRTGGHELRSLHIPDGVTGASRRRLARLLGAHGA